MKKVTIIFAALTLVGAIAAQKKPAPPAKPAAPPAKPAAPAATAKPPVQAPPAVAAKATDPVAKPGEVPPESTKSEPFEISAKVWGGYNVSISSEYNAYTTADGYTVNKGGVAGGAEVIAGISYIKAGLGVTYMPIFSYQNATLLGTGTMTQNVLPIEFLFNIFPTPSIYFGLRGGWVDDLGSSTISGFAHTRTNGSSFGGQLGYIHQIGPVGIDAGVMISYIALSAGSGTTTTTNFLNIVPRLGVVFKF